MKKFKFRLETVEKLKSIREKQALTELAKIRMLLVHGETLRDSIKSAIQRNLDSRAKSLDEKNIDARELQLLHKHSTGLKQRLMQADRLIGKMKKEEAKTLGLYIEAKKALGVFEKLHENSFARFKEELKKAEQTEMDDLNSMRFRSQREVA